MVKYAETRENLEVPLDKLPENAMSFDIKVFSSDNNDIVMISIARPYDSGFAIECIKRLDNGDLDHDTLLRFDTQEELENHLKSGISF